MANFYWLLCSLIIPTLTSYLFHIQFRSHDESIPPSAMYFDVVFSFNVILCWALLYNVISSIYLLKASERFFISFSIFTSCIFMILVFRTTSDLIHFIVLGRPISKEFLYNDSKNTSKIMLKLIEYFPNILSPNWNTVYNLLKRFLSSESIRNASKFGRKMIVNQ